MPVRSQIIDGTGTRRAVGVTKDNRLLVSAAITEDVSTGSGSTAEDLTTIPFRQYFTSTGAAGGSSAMNVNGSVTPQEFYIDAPQDGDRYITILSLAVSDSSATPAKFGGITALTKGFQVYFTSAKYGVIYIHDGIKTNFEMMRFGMGTPSIGGAGDAFRVSNVIGNADTYMTFVDLSKLMPPYGVRLKYLSTQKLTIRIRDDLTALDGFDCVAYGFTRLP